MEIQSVLQQAAKYWLDGHLNNELGIEGTLVGYLAKEMGNRMKVTTESMRLAGMSRSDISAFEQRYQLWMYETLQDMAETFKEDVDEAETAYQSIKHLSKAA